MPETSDWAPKDMDRAGLHALREGMQSCGSINTMSDRWHHFAQFARQEWSVKDMRKLDREHVQQYADHLRERFERGELAPATAQNYLSAVSRVLEIARGDRHCHVNPVRDAGLPTRTRHLSDKSGSWPRTSGYCSR